MRERDNEREGGRERAREREREGEERGGQRRERARDIFSSVFQEHWISLRSMVGGQAHLTSLLAIYIYTCSNWCAAVLLTTAGRFRSCECACTRVCVYSCVCLCVCWRGCVRACVHACVRTCMCPCACVRMPSEALPTRPTPAGRRCIVQG